MKCKKSKTIQQMTLELKTLLIKELQTRIEIEEMKRKIDKAVNARLQQDEIDNLVRILVR